MKVKTSELTGAALDWAVAKCEGVSFVWLETDYSTDGHTFQRGTAQAAGPHYSTNWSQGGPIIERGLLHVSPEFWTGIGWQWSVCVLGPGNLDENYAQRGPTPLISAMRCYVASKLGDTVEIPDSLL